MELKNKTCIPCSGAIPALPLSELAQFKQHLHPDWQLTHEHTRLYRRFEFKGFKRPMTLAILIGDMAEEENHHPELHIGYGHLEVEVWTHKIGGLVESDFIFAAKVDAIFQNFLAN